MSDLPETSAHPQVRLQPRRKLPGWAIALMVVGILGTLAICVGLGVGLISFRQAIPDSGQSGDGDTHSGIEVRNARLIAAGNGSYTIAGELVNYRTTSARISELTGTLLDSRGNLVATGQADDLCRLLHPAGVTNGLDYAPFAITLEVPVDGPVTEWSINIDSTGSEIADPIPLYFEFAAPYIDGFGRYHIVGTCENRAAQTYQTSLVAGLYDAQGMVIDASAAGIPLRLKPGDKIPFDLSQWNVVNNDPEYAAAIDYYTVQSDPYWTYALNGDLVELTTVTVTRDERSPGQVNLGSTLVNDSGKILQDTTVVGYLTDAAGTLVAVQVADIVPDGGAFIDGFSTDFEMTFWLDPAVDASSLTVNFIAQGLGK